MSRPNPILIKNLRKSYPKGTKLELVRMEDSQAPPIGTIGEVVYVDDLGTIHMNWENGSSLGLCFGTDLFIKVE